MVNPRDLSDYQYETLGRGRGRTFQSFAGTDITVSAYIASEYLGPSVKNTNDFIKFGQIQTISISSTRSVSPVRVLGRSSPLAYTRGARTFAGTMVFASINHDVFQPLYRHSLTESTMYHSTSIVADQIPPFNVVIVAANEKGGAATQAIYDITLVNYGTTYSIDDLYTEVTYTYVAKDVSPLSNMSISMASNLYRSQSATAALKTISDLAQESNNLYYSPGTLENTLAKIKRDILYANKNVDPITYPDDPFYASQIPTGSFDIDEIKEQLGISLLKSNGTKAVPLYNFNKRLANDFDTF